MAKSDRRNGTRTSVLRQEALHRATHSDSVANYPAIYAGFQAKGIAEADIEPRVNVFTFHAWLANGRQVRKGEHGVRVETYVEIERKDGADEAEEPQKFRRPRTTTVFHVSQTEPITNNA